MKYEWREVLNAIAQNCRERAINVRTSINPTKGTAAAPFGAAWAWQCVVDECMALIQCDEAAAERRIDELIHTENKYRVNRAHDELCVVIVYAEEPAKSLPPPYPQTRQIIGHGVARDELTAKERALVGIDSVPHHRITTRWIKE